MIKLISIVMVCLVSTALAAVEVRFIKTPVVQSGVIMLTDIAKLSGDAKAVEKLSTVEIGRTAKAGRVRIVQTGTLKQFYINPVVPIKNIDFYNEGKIEVLTEAKFLPGSEIEALAREAIEKKYRKNKMYEVTLKGIPQSISVPLKNWYMDIELGRNFDAKGREVVYVIINHNNTVFRRIKIQAEIKVYEDVVFSTRFIKRGSKISESDLEVRNIETTNINRPVVRTKKDIIGKETKRSLNRERMVLFSSIDEPFLVKRGMKTRIQVKMGDGVIYAMAIARENGREGDVVRVQNNKSKKMIRGTVAADGTVWVQN